MTETVRKETFINLDSPGYTLLEDIRKQTGIKRKTLDDRLSQQGISTFSSPKDRRKRMVRNEDLDLILGVQQGTPRTLRSRHKVG